jgi:acetamidase/formamidase
VAARPAGDDRDDGPAGQRVEDRDHPAPAHDRQGGRGPRGIEWPRLEDAEHIMVAASARPLTDALRIAAVELVGWLAADHGFGRADAYRLASQVAVVRVANVVDPLYTVVAKFPKSHLPRAAAPPAIP